MGNLEEIKKYLESEVFAEKLERYRKLYFDKIQELILSKYPDAEIYLFGSYAKGKETEDSDIDISIKVPNMGKPIYRYDKLFDKIISQQVGKQVNSVYCTLDNEWCLFKL